jgi:hypothetical protein
MPQNQHSPSIVCETVDLTLELGGSGTGHSYVAQAELLKLQRSGQFPDELVKIEGTQIHYVASQTSNSRHKGDSVRGILL